MRSRGHALHRYDRRAGAPRSRNRHAARSRHPVLADLPQGTGAHVGCCGLRPRAPGTLELGFHLHRAHWGAGLASEAARATIAFAFDTLGAASLFAGHHPANDPSRRLLSKLGFVHTHDELYPATGLEHPSYLLRAPTKR